MKKLIYIFVSVVVLTTWISCSSDDNSSPETLLEEEQGITESQFIGKWKITDVSSEDVKTSVLFSGDEVLSDYTIKGGEFDYEVEYNSNPNTAEGKGFFTLEITTVTALFGPATSATDIETFDVDNFNGFNASEWILLEENKIISWVNGETKTEATIREISESKIVLNIDLSKSDILNLSDYNIKKASIHHFCIEAFCFVVEVD